MAALDEAIMNSSGEETEEFLTADEEEDDILDHSSSCNDNIYDQHFISTSQDNSSTMPRHHPGGKAGDAPAMRPSLKNSEGQGS